MKIEGALAPKYQAYNLLCGWYFKFLYHLLKASTAFMQAEVRIKEDRITDLQETLKTQQAETDKARVEITSALSITEQLKEGFKKERTDWATEKADLIKRAENAEAALKPVVDELTAVKRQVHSMTAAIFGKLLLVSGTTLACL